MFPLYYDSQQFEIMIEDENLETKNTGFFTFDILNIFNNCFLNIKNTCRYFNVIVILSMLSDIQIMKITLTCKYKLSYTCTKDS